MSDKTVRLLVEVNKENRKIVYDATSEEITSALGYTPMDAALKGANDGVSELDENGKVVATQLPSFVDDVIEGYYTNDKFYKESTHVTEIDPESGKIYVDLSTEKTYRWSGTQYVIISDTIALGETSSTAYRGDRGKIAYDHSQEAHAPSNAEKNQNAFSNIKVGNTNITSNDTSDTVNITAGKNVSVTADSNTKTVTISATDTTYENATDTVSGLFSPEYKKLVDDVKNTYLPLSGGTIASDNFSPLIIKRNNAVDAAGIGFINSDKVLGYVGMNTENKLCRISSDVKTFYTILDESNYATYVTPAGIGAAASNHNHDTAYASKTHTHTDASTTASGFMSAADKTTINGLGDASSKTIKTATNVTNLGWSDQATAQKYVPDLALIAWWNGACNSANTSNLAYCNQGAFGTAATKGVDTTVTSGSVNLVTSGGVYSKLYQYRPMVVLPGTSGSTGYVCFAELKVAGNYVNAPIEFKISSRGRFICNVTVRFASKGNTDPDIETLSFCGQDYKIYAYKSATSTWQLYALKSESYDSITVLATYRPGQFNGTITYPGTLAATKHTGTTTNPVVDSTWGYKVGTANNATTVNNHTVNADVPSDAKFTDTTYSNFVKSGSGAKAGLVPAPSTTAGTTKYLREDGTWTVPPNTNTDTKVTETNTTTSAAYRLLLSYNANDTSETTTTRKSTNFTANPSTGVLTSKYLKTSQGGKLLSQTNLSNATSANVTVSDIYNYKEVAVEICTMYSSKIAYVRGIIPLQYVENGNQFNIRVEGENDSTDFIAVTKSSTTDTLTFSLRFTGTLSSYKMSTIILISI